MRSASGRKHNQTPKSAAEFRRLRRFVLPIRWGFWDFWTPDEKGGGGGGAFERERQARGPARVGQDGAHTSALRSGTGPTPVTVSRRGRGGAQGGGGGALLESLASVCR